MDKRLLTVKEAAAYLAISPTTLYHWIARREVPVVRLRRKAVRFDRADLDATIARSKCKSKKEVSDLGTIQARQDMVVDVLERR